MPVNCLWTRNYREKIPCYVALYNDTLQQPSLKCKVTNPVYNKEKPADDAAGWNIFPNPNDGTFSITATDLPAAIFIRNYVGQLVYTSELRNEQSAVHLPLLPSGLYEISMV